MHTTIVDDFKGRGVNYGGENCNDLPVLRCLYMRGNRVCVSAWQFTPEQLAEIQANGGKAYVYIWGGTQPPMYVDHQNPMTGMGDVDEMIANLKAMVDNLNELKQKGKHAVDAGSTQDHIKSIIDAIASQTREAETLAWMLNV